MADIFISYAREDLDSARRIVNLIEDNGWSVFWDRTIPPGLTWRAYIGTALDNAKCVIVIWSHTSVNSEFVQEEADDGRERKILIPILIDDARPPLGFRAIQHENFTEWKGESDHRRARSLIKAIEGVAGKPKKETDGHSAEPTSELPSSQNQILKPIQKESIAEPSDTPPKLTSNHRVDNSARKRKTHLLFKLGPLAVSLSVAAIILIIGPSIWFKKQNPPIVSPPDEIEKPSSQNIITDRDQVEPANELSKPDGKHPKTFSNGIGMEFVLIPSGAFTMGRFSGVGPNSELPSHTVNISLPFYLLTTEVTQGQWKKVMGNNPSAAKNCGDDCPVENFSWNDAHKFIQKLNEIEGTGKYRLPTEAEWEYACRAGTNTEFFFGDDAGMLGEFAWFKDNSNNRTHPVGQKKPNPWALYDMNGNVHEWVEDDWHENFAGTPADGRAWLDAPRGIYRVFRGGSWADLAYNCRSASRSYNGPDVAYPAFGFRLARSVDPGS